MTTTTEPQTSTIHDSESVYAAAARDASRVPWASAGPSSALVNWLNAIAPSLVRCGARVAVVGCGLGADARELLRRGYEVTAFDSSPTAVRWARELDPEHAGQYVSADLFDPPARWVHRHDLVVDIGNLDFMEPALRGGAVAAVSKLMAPRGYLLIVARGADRPAADGSGPPWPLTERELLEAASGAGLAPEGPVSLFTDDENVPRIRAAFRRG